MPSMSDTNCQPKIVQALYSFQPANTDEICFQKGDIITVTQVVDGGWWEGTLRGITGWFPSNYVQEIKAVIGETRAGARSPTGKVTDMKQIVRHDATNAGATVTNNHLVVLQELIGSEKKFVSVMEELLDTYLSRLDANDSLLTADEYSSLSSNLVDIVSVHKDLLSSLEDIFRLPVAQQRFGGLFLELAAKIQSLYYKYSANHPCAVAVLQSKRDELSRFMEEEMGASSPGVMTLTTYLSRPFQQIERYSSLLKELERHSEEAHVDRGDTQRAIVVYRDIALTCTEIRKQKEIEFDILNADIEAWEGEEMSSLGDVVMLSHVRLETSSSDTDSERHERLLMLFPGVLLVLSVTPRVSGYIYRGRMSLSNATVNNADSVDKTAFHITDGDGCDELTVICTSLQDKSKWLTALKPHVKAMHASAVVKPQHLQVVRRRSHESPSKSITVNSSTFSRPLPVTTRWNMSCLRPCPPLRPSTFLKDEGTRSPRAGRRLLGGYGRRKLVDDVKILEDDAFILRVIEAYCTSAKVRQAVNSSLLESPQVLIAEEEKIIVEEMKGDQTVVEEKTLVDTVYSLKDQVRELRQEQQRLRRDVDTEKRARKRLETLLRHSLKSIVENTVTELHDTSTGSSVNP